MPSLSAKILHVPNSNPTGSVPFRTGPSPDPSLSLPRGALLCFFNFLLSLLICGSLLELKVVDQIKHNFFIAGVVVVDLLFHSDSSARPRPSPGESTLPINFRCGLSFRHDNFD